MTPKGRVPGVVVRNARIRGNVNEGVVYITRPECFMFSLACSTDGRRMGNDQAGQNPRLLQTGNLKWSVAHPAENCKKCSQLLITGS